MNKETLKQIITQIKKYELTNEFKNKEEFQEWISKLNNIQINNFITIDIPLENIKNIKHLLLNENLLNCYDYKQKITALTSLKNADGWYHLFERLCNPNFLNSKNFYKDIEMLSKADNAKYGLRILGEDAFINSPYHEEDLKLLIETHDIKEEEPLDFIVSEAIASIASNIDSINSPYHQKDIKLIATSGSDYLQSTTSYPESSINNLAINKESLKDKYHIENMQILAKNPIAAEFLYEVMTTPHHIKSKNYRQEIEALTNAKSKNTARALYYYIVNPEKKFSLDLHYYDDRKFDMKDAYISYWNYTKETNNEDYLNNLKIINETDDKFVMHLVSLLMNPDFIKSPHKNFDLQILLNSTNNKSIFMDLYELMTNTTALNSPYHKQDIIIINQTLSDGIRDLLLQKAWNKHSNENKDHIYDMEYITKLKLNSINEKIYNEIIYYLFIPNGLKTPNRKEILEKLSQGIFIERTSNITNYLNDLENELNNIENNTKNISKPKSLIKKLINNKKFKK